MKTRGPARRPGSPRRWWVACSLLVGGGFGLSAYLLQRAFALLGASRPGDSEFGSALFTAACDAALADERSWILGVPLAGWGLVFFTVLGGLLFLARFLGRSFADEGLAAGWLLTVAGAGAGFALSVNALRGHGAFCPLCLAIHAKTLLLVFALMRANAKSVGEQLRLVRGGADWLLRSRSPTPTPVRWKLVGFGGVGLLAVVAYQWIYVESALRRPRAAPPPDGARILAAYRASPRVALQVSARDPHLGPLDAPVQLVAFASFACPACRDVTGTLQRPHWRFADRLLIVFKHYPLSVKCNARLTEDQQPYACEAAWAAEAAHRQGQFWRFHDALFAAGDGASEAAITRTVRGLRLDPERFAADRESQSAKARVAADVDLGTRLQIPGTPAVFLDGRLVRPAGGEILELLIRQALESARPDRAPGGLHASGVKARPS